MKMEGKEKQDMSTMELKSSLLLKEVSHVIADDEMTQKVIEYIRKLRRDKRVEQKGKLLAPIGISQQELIERAKEGIANVAVGDVLSQKEMLNRKPQSWK